MTVRFEIENPGHKTAAGHDGHGHARRCRPKRLPCSLRAAAGSESGSRMLGEGRVLAVPESAVIDTGHADDRLSRDSARTFTRECSVELGPRMSGPDDVPVLSRCSTAWPRANGSSPRDRFWSMPRRGSIRPPVRSISAAAARNRASSVTRRPRRPKTKRKCGRCEHAGGPHSPKRSLSDPGQNAGSMGTGEVTIKASGFLCCDGCKKRLAIRQDVGQSRARRRKPSPPTRACGIGASPRPMRRSCTSTAGRTLAEDRQWRQQRFAPCRTSNGWARWGRRSSS